MQDIVHRLVEIMLQISIIILSRHYLHYAQFPSFVLMILTFTSKLLYIFSHMHTTSSNTVHKTLLTLYNVAISVLVTSFFQITNFHYIQHSTRGRN